MKKIRCLFPIWILILTILLQSAAYAEIEQEVINTAPTADFTMEKNRNVKMLVLTDYTGTDNTDLKNALTTVKSELANSAKINIEYVNPEITKIGKQNGKLKTNNWAKNGYASYTKSGYDNYKQYGEPVWNDYFNEKVYEKFVYSKYITLPEEETPDELYGVPIKSLKSDLQERVINQGGAYSYREYYTYSFINNNGICDGTYSITVKYENSSPAGFWSEGWVSSYTQPVFTFEDFWSIQGTNEQSIENDVIGWDLSNLNYEIQDSTDTFVVFALNRGNTNYYKANKDSNYLLGQLRNDTTLGKYIKDSDARVYSICSEEIENLNLSKDAMYPITFKSTSQAQNASIYDLMDSSFDGRSVGEKNITGLSNRIKENIRRPNGSVDMIVASDNDKTSLGNFVENVRNSVSDDVSVSANIIDGDSFEDTDTWTRYITKGDFKSFTMYNSDATLILTGNGELWGMGSNFIGEIEYEYEKWKKVYGLFGLSTTVERYDKFVKIADNVKDVYLTYLTNGNCIYIIKNDGTLWVSGGYNRTYVEDRKGNLYDRINYYQGFYYTGYSDVKSLAFHMINTWEMHIVSGNGVYRIYMDRDWEYSPPMKDTLAPANTKYLRGVGYSESYQLIYVGEDGKSTYSSWRYGYLRENKLYDYYSTPLPANPVEVAHDSNVFKCGDKYYNFSNGKSILDNLNVKIRQLYIDRGICVISEDGQLYQYMGTSWAMAYNRKNIDKILFIQSNGAMIVRALDGKIGFYDKINPENTFRTEDLSWYDGQSNGYDVYNSTLTEFDATAGGLAADYLQIGDRFCYVTKTGEICYVEAENKGRDEFYMYTTKFKTVNCGKLDEIFNISYKTVKAISKSKIFNTPLREGSERYFIYISDNVQQDTYFVDHTEYFPFSHLDNAVLNYLNANKFNIFVVTPAQAKDLKLIFPYVPANRQQISLRELIYNSTMDSAFCKDTETVRKLIERRYDSYTKHGSTTITLLVNEESLKYNQVYRDFENDPKYSEKWLYTHDPSYFDNSNGLDSNSGQWSLTPLYTFSKVGKYVVNAQFRDNPNDDDRFDNYRLWSNKSAPGTILVHRRPIALFNVQVESKVGTNIKLAYLDQSFDLDHNITRADKGIVARLWQYKKIDSDIWLSGKPSALNYNSGKYDIQLKVKDVEGVWSRPYVDQIDTNNLPPSINATPLTYTGAGPLNITIKASDNGEDDFAYMRYAVTDRSELPASSQWIKVAEGINERSIALNADGTYYLHMEAYDKLGQVGKNLAGPYIINNVKAGNFFITMMLDIGWRAYYFDLDRGIDDNHDGMIDRYPRRQNTDIGTLKMPINYYNLVSSPRTYIKAGYRVKGRIDIQGNPDSARFKINYRVKEAAHTDTVSLVKGSGDTYTFEWIIPLDTDDKSFISFDLEMIKGSIIYGNEKWKDVWDTRNSSRYVFYVCGKATDDLIYIQSQ